MAAPVVLTSEELSTREARTVVFVSSEEILPRKIPAYVKSKSEISWLFRQPSASAIMINKPFVELELQFTLTKKNAGGAGQVIGAADIAYSKAEAGNAAAQLYGRSMEGLPFLSKCVRTSVISINGATQTYRNSEMFTSYLRSQVGREAMRKLNVPWNSMCKQKQGFANGYAQRTDYKILSESDSEQVSSFDLATSMDNTLAAGVAAFDQFPVPQQGHRLTKRMVFREPLFMGVFGGLQGNDSFPLWSCEQNKSPSILHAQNITINLNLLDNWAQNLYGLIQVPSSDAHLYAIEDVSVVTANLCCTYVQPPPKFIASALSSNVTYASTKFLRFEREAAGQTTQIDPVAAGGAPTEFVFQVVSFPYMPSCFMIEIQPDYNTKSKRVAQSGAGGAFVANGGVQASFDTIEASKLDKRLSIVQLDLIINTSPDVVPSHGANVYNDANIINIRYNARQLYELYLKNCASMERAIYSFEQWFRSGCTVLLTPADFNGILTPAHCRGNISVSGTIYAVNHMGYSVYVGSGSPGAAQGAAAAWPHGTMEKFRAAIVGVYSNSYLALDAKSGLVGENVMSEQFAAGLRLTDI